MIIAFEGNLGAGKTLGMTVFTWYFSLMSDANVLSNLPLRADAFQKHSAKNPDFWLGYLDNFDDFIPLTERGGGIVAWDEFHQSVDSRSWARKTQVYFTEFAMYLRKINAPLFFTSQSVANQIDVRIRQIIDGIIVCRKSPQMFHYTMYDAVTYRYKKSWKLPRFFIQKFFSVYDSYRIVRPVSFPSTERAYIDFLDGLEKAVRRSPAIRRRDIPLDPFFMVES